MGSNGKKEKFERKERDCERFNMKGEKNKIEHKRDSEKRDGRRKKGMD